MAETASKKKKILYQQTGFNLRKKPASGPGSSVSIVTEYGLESPGSNPRGNGIFRPSRQALGPTQPHEQWVTGLSRG